MLNRFIRFIEDQKLFSRDEKILLAVSGGIDSLVMTELFHQAGYMFAIAHCNFRLRKEESDEDARFVRELGMIYNVPVFENTFDTEIYANKHGISVQMAARELRYKWFDEILNSQKFSYCATAHHLDDQIETFFINLMRGTGIAGLHGIQLKINNIIRPLLFCTRNDIEAFANKHNLIHHEDSTNATVKYTRNKIRHQLIPLLKEINPSIAETISKEIELFREAEQIYKETILSKKAQLLKHKGTQSLILIDELKKLNPIKTYLYEFLSDYQFKISTIEDIIDALDDIPGKQFFSSTHRVIKDRIELIITPILEKEEDFSGVQIDESDDHLSLPIHLKCCRIDQLNIFKISKSPLIASLDFDKLTFPLTLRKWKRGDFFYPFGLNKRKKVSDYFSDHKFSIADKENTWLLCSGENIVWIVGHRIDERFRITADTKDIYLLEMA